MWEREVVATTHGVGGVDVGDVVHGIVKFKRRAWIILSEIMSYINHHNRRYQIAYVPASP